MILFFPFDLFANKEKIGYFFPVDGCVRCFFYIISTRSSRSDVNSKEIYMLLK